MARQRVIVGLGEAVLAEHPDREEPEGLAPLIAASAVLLGHRGIAISRLGQDQAARTLLERLVALGVDTSHLQSDPDLPTCRRIVRTGVRSVADAQAAFDNLQWDFDLSDMAQVADAVVFGALARRSGQTRSTCDRFLAECRLALRLFDLTNRPAGGLVRSLAMPALQGSEAAALDPVALRQLFHGASAAAPQEALLEVLRQTRLSLVIYCEEGRPLVLHDHESSQEGTWPYRRDAHEACLVAVVHGVLSGWDLADSLRLAERLADHVITRPGERPPRELVQRS
jgi:sugar/nucleoside kinase (ribokinase family)